MIGKYAVSTRVSSHPLAAFGLLLAGALLTVSTGHAQPCTPGWDSVTDLGNPGLTSSLACDCFEQCETETVRAMQIFDDGAGPQLYVGGIFRYAGNNPIGEAIARWDGQNWSHVFLGVAGGSPWSEITAMEVFDDGTGPALYVCGDFAIAGGVVSALNIAKWDGSQWSALGGGLLTIVMDMTVFDDGTGPALYAVENGGDIWKWDGMQWASLGKPGPGYPSGALVVYDDGNGPALYVCGGFSGAVAKWNGAQWAIVGGGVSGPVSDAVVWDDGTGPALYVCGVSFFTAGGQSAVKVAKWDGQTWSPLGPGIANGVFELEVFDDGSGEALYAAGNIIGTADGSQSFSRFAKWDGQQWSPITPANPNMLNGQATIPLTLYAGDMGDGQALYVGGDFCQVRQDGSWVDSHLIAVWRAGSGPEGDIDGNNVVDLTDLGMLLGMYGLCDGDAGFNPDADLDQSTCIDLTDLGVLLANYGQACP